MVECGVFLVQAEPGKAWACFQDAEKLWPDSADVVFGVALSEMVYGAELSIMVTSVTQQAADPGPGPREPPAGAVPGIREVTSSRNEYLAAEIHNILLRLRLHFANASDRLRSLEGRPLAFDIEKVPVHLGLKPTLVFRGTFDAGDVLLMRAIADGTTGIFDTLAGQDLNTDLLGLVAFVKNAMKGTKVDYPTISHFLAYLLNVDSRFLMLEPKDGPWLFEDARTRFAEVAPTLRAAIDAIRAGGAGEGHVSLVEDRGGAAVLVVRNAARDDEAGARVESPMSFELTPALLDRLSAVSDSLRNPGRPVTLQGGMLTVLAAMVSVAVRAGVLDGLGVSLPIDLGTAEIGDLEFLLRSLLPDVLAFDWGTFYREPVGLRAWFPAVTDDRGGMDDVIVTEWECPADLDGGYPKGSLRMVCSKDAVLEDGTHFAGTEWEVARDGTASGFPVFGWPDATWSHLLKVDLEAGGVADRYADATPVTLNAALAKLLEKVIGLLGGL